MTHKGRVSPFGHPRIKACSRLPMAFRSVPRPSSPLGAKASTRCPSHTRARSRPPVARGPRPRTESGPPAKERPPVPKTITASTPTSAAPAPRGPPPEHGTHPHITLVRGAPPAARTPHDRGCARASALLARPSSSPCPTPTPAGAEPGPTGDLDRSVGCVLPPPANRRPRTAERDVVEANGLEPMTSGLQSRRSPN
jgi:hypothetical protein